MIITTPHTTASTAERNGTILRTVSVSSEKLPTILDRLRKLGYDVTREGISTYKAVLMGKFRTVTFDIGLANMVISSTFLSVRRFIVDYVDKDMRARSALIRIDRNNFDKMRLMMPFWLRDAGHRFEKIARWYPEGTRPRPVPTKTRKRRVNRGWNGK